MLNTFDIAIDPVIAKPSELGLDEKEYKKTRRISDTKMNFYVKDKANDVIYFIKTGNNRETIFREWFVNDCLKNHSIPNIIYPICWFDGKFSEKSIFDSGYLVLPFLKGQNLGSTKKRDFKDLTLLEGIRDIIGLLQKLNIEEMPGQDIYLTHHDLGEGQIYYGYDDKTWYLIDFGNAECTHKTSIMVDGQNLRSILTVRVPTTQSFDTKGDDWNRILFAFARRKLIP